MSNPFEMNVLSDNELDAVSGGGSPLGDAIRDSIAMYSHPAQGITDVMRNISNQARLFNARVTYIAGLMHR